MVHNTYVFSFFCLSHKRDSPDRETSRGLDMKLIVSRVLFGESIHGYKVDIWSLLCKSLRIIELISVSNLFTVSLLQLVYRRYGVTDWVIVSLRGKTSICSF